MPTQNDVVAEVNRARRGGARFAKISGGYKLYALDGMSALYMWTSVSESGGEYAYLMEASSSESMGPPRTLRSYKSAITWVKDNCYEAGAENEADQAEAQA